MSQINETLQGARTRRFSIMPAVFVLKNVAVEGELADDDGVGERDLHPNL